MTFVARECRARVLQLRLEIGGAENLRLVEGGTNDDVHVLPPFLRNTFLVIVASSSLTLASSFCRSAISLRNVSSRTVASTGARVTCAPKALASSGSSVKRDSVASASSMRARRSVRNFSRSLIDISAGAAAGRQQAFVSRQRQTFVRPSCVKYAGERIGSLRWTQRLLTLQSSKSKQAMSTPSSSQGGQSGRKESQSPLRSQP